MRALRPDLAANICSGLLLEQPQQRIIHGSA
jgi:hypothetical protein